MEFGAEFGRITFNEKPAIEPMTIIRLIQQQPQRYQLDNKQRLKFIKKMEDGESRLAAIDELINQLR
jgi:transcription-repair coupling factor (superfamily II helicase)